MNKCYTIKYNNVRSLCGYSSVVRALPCQGRGQELESPYPHHKWTIFGNGVRKRSFFFGCAERKPDVFRGRKRIMGSRRLRLFGF